MGEALNVVAVVLNWRRPDDTIACVRSLRETAPETGVVVVDNASGGGSVARLRDALPFADLIENPRNEGYAGGNNPGIRRALDRGADAVLVLNNDVIVRPGCVARLAGQLEDDPRIAIAAPLSLRQDDPGLVDFYRADIDLKNMAVVAEGRDRPWHGGDVVRDTDYATGSAMLLRADWLARAGAFDERYFLVWEDVDLSLRARADGQRCVVVPEAQVLHGRSVSFGGEGSPLYQYFYVRNSFLIAATHLPRLRRGRARAMLERRYAGWVEQADDGSTLRRALALGLEHGVAGRFGPPPRELSV